MKRFNVCQILRGFRVEAYLKLASLPKQMLINHIDL